jgi:hypothetical protein
VARSPEDLNDDASIVVINEGDDAEHAVAPAALVEAVLAAVGV